MKQLQGIDTFPLSWPVGWVRTAKHQRRNSRYEVSFAGAREDLLRSLRLLGATEVVISSNVPTRRDGIPYANYEEPGDPAVAVYWVQSTGKTGGGVPKVMACDHWKTVRENLRAVGLALEGLRSIERSGASQILERAFQGFAALPPSTKRPWRQVLEIENGHISRELVDERFKALARVRHPDIVGGSHDAMTELNVAKGEAYKELGL